MSVAEPIESALRKPTLGPRASLSKWGGFVHLLARFYMDYYAAVLKAAKKKGNKKAVDIDVHRSKQGTVWALHWGTVGQNHLHDPQKKISKHARIDSLTDAQIRRLRSASGKRVHKLVALLDLAHEHGVRVEVELKVYIPQPKLSAILARPKTALMKKAGRIQFKTLAQLPHPEKRLRAAHRAGGVTILSFTGYKGKGVSKELLWPWTDYVRGKAKWVA